MYAVLTVINKKLPRLDVTFPHGRVYTRKFDASGEKWTREVEFGYVSAVKTIIVSVQCVLFVKARCLNHPITL